MKLLHAIAILMCVVILAYHGKADATEVTPLPAPRILNAECKLEMVEWDAKKRGVYHFRKVKFPAVFCIASTGQALVSDCKTGEFLFKWGKSVGLAIAPPNSKQWTRTHATAYINQLYHRMVTNFDDDEPKIFMWQTVPDVFTPFNFVARDGWVVAPKGFKKWAWENRAAKSTTFTIRHFLAGAGDHAIQFNMIGAKHAFNKYVAECKSFGVAGYIFKED